MIFLLKRENKAVNWDEYDAKVVIANCEEEARAIASAKTGDEGSAAWLAPELSTCQQIDPNGQSAELLGSFKAG